MASLGFRTVDEMIGRAECIDFQPAKDHWKASGLDLDPVLLVPDVPADAARRHTRAQDAGLAAVMDHQLIAAARPALEHRAPVELSTPIRNTDRTTGTMLGYEVTRRFGGDGLPDDTIRVSFTGSAGQSFGAFIPRGITLALEGEANDFVGKGLSGGRLIVRPPVNAAFAAEDNVIIGNVALYGATSGTAFFRGVAGERFAVRNSGAHAVVEGVGDHGCEYMTGGRVIVLGRTGRNFAAGMSGGIAYVLDTDGSFALNCNIDMVNLEHLDQPEEVSLVRDLITRHVALTGSAIGGRVLDSWATAHRQFVAVMPRDFKRVTAAEARARSESREPAFSELVA
jgi:glutamate synthase (ferredoxin)